jgi:NAD+ synthetase
MRIVLCQINPKVSAVERNTARILEVIRENARSADVLVFPELSVPGYPPTDLLSKNSFRARIRTANDILVAASLAHDCTIIFGTALADPTGQSARLCNAAVVAQNGTIRAEARKILLPTYGVYDESRFFSAGGGDVCVFELNGVPVGLAICEDFWTVDDPSDHRFYDRKIASELKAKGARVLINLSASPWHLGKVKERADIVGGVPVETGVPTLYCNLVGANDDLIFDGRSLCWDGNGVEIARARAYEEDVLIVDLQEDGSPVGITQTHSAPPDDSYSDVAHALALGVRDYCAKSGIGSVLVGMSGGIDSAVTASLASFALGPENVTGVAMPGNFSSQDSLLFAHEQAKALGIAFLEIPISAGVDTMASTIEQATGKVLQGLSHENLQARMRGLTLMALSNRDGAMVLNTGNKSELATGYCTLYGDMVGGLAVLGDLLKNQVYALGRALDELHGSQVIPEGVYDRPPSAELSADQVDEDTLPPYSLLDTFVDRYVREDFDAVEAAPEGLDGAHWARSVERMDFKRHQAPPILRVSSRSFGRGRRTMNAKG